MASLVTYRAPEGDDLSVTWLGYTFHDGEPLAVDNDSLLSKARTNRWFEVSDSVAEEAPVVPVEEPVTADKVVKRKPGRPRKEAAPESPADPVDNAEVGA